MALMSICGLAGWLGEISMQFCLDHMRGPLLRGHYCEGETAMHICEAAAWIICEATIARPNSIISLKSLQLHSIDAFPLLNYAFSFAYALDVFVLAICLVIFLT